MRAFLANRQSFLIAFLILVSLTAWMLSGRHTQSGATANEVNEPVIERVTEVSVRVRTLKPETVQKHVILHGTTEASRTVTVSAEIEGRIVEVLVERGATVAAGDVIARVDGRERDALLLEALAAVEQARLQHKATAELAAQNFQSETEVASALAALEGARANLQRVRVELSNTIVRAPFDGVVDKRPVEVGDYVAAGDPVAYILDADPMLVVGHVAQQKRRDIEVGTVGEIVLVTGENLTGRVRYVAAESDPQTRTFRVELEVDNQDGTLASGLTGEIRVPTKTYTAHFLPTSLLSLGEGDQLGVKAVNAQSMVEFHEVQIVRATPAGLWVAGLPDQVRVITVGHGFVRAGDKVITVDEDSLDTAGVTTFADSYRPDDA